MNFFTFTTINIKISLYAFVYNIGIYVIAKAFFHIFYSDSWK